MVTFANRAKMTTTTTGTGALTLGSAVDGFQTFDAAGVSDSDVVRYVIEDGDDWEIGEGTYTASGTTLTRTVLESSNADTAISLSGDAQVFIGLAAGDVEPANSEILKADTHDTLTAGFDSASEALGTVTTGTITPEVDGSGEENFKTLINGGAFTLAPPSTSGNCTILIQVTNNASAGSITTSGFTILNGDTYDTTDGNDWLFHIKKVGSFTSLTIEALQ